mgnify:CR=1 FL=1
MNSMEKVNQFRDERNWRQFHNEKDLAISISLEASELLELFQWKNAGRSKRNTIRTNQRRTGRCIDLFIHDGRQPSAGSR